MEERHRGCKGNTTVCAFHQLPYLLTDGMFRMANMSKAKKNTSATSINSEGWRNGSEAIYDDSDNDSDEVPHQHPGRNEHVNVIAPEDVHSLQRNPQTLLHKKSTGELPGVIKEAKVGRSGSSGSEGSFLTAEEEPLILPGSFDPKNVRREVTQEYGEEEPEDFSWAGLFKRMGLRS